MNQEVFKMMMLNTMGESILVETIRSAVYFAHRSDNNFQTKNKLTKEKMREGEKCYIFMQSTGLDILIEEYDLGYDPDEVRLGFNYLLRVKT